MDAVASNIEAVGDVARAHLLHPPRHGNTALNVADCRPLIRVYPVSVRWADPNSFFSHCVVPFRCTARSTGCGGYRFRMSVVFVRDGLLARVELLVKQAEQQERRRPLADKGAPALLASEPEQSRDGNGGHRRPVPALPRDPVGDPEVVLLGLLSLFHRCGVHHLSSTEWGWVARVTGAGRCEVPPAGPVSIHIDHLLADRRGDVLAVVHGAFADLDFFGDHSLLLG